VSLANPNEPTSATVYPWQRSDVVRQSQRICRSYQHWLGQPLLPGLDIEVVAPQQLAQILYNVDFVILSHGTETDPILNYGNQRALDLWQASWLELTKMPSRLTAEPMERQERAKLLAQAAAQGYIDGYRGIRIARNGQRFWIENAIIWTILDEQGAIAGQAATFAQWQPLSQDT
jgi:MEKHLA domain